PCQVPRRWRRRAARRTHGDHCRNRQAVSVYRRGRYLYHRRGPHTLGWRRTQLRTQKPRQLKASKWMMGRDVACCVSCWERKTKSTEIRMPDNKITRRTWLKSTASVLAATAAAPIASNALLQTDAPMPGPQPNATSPSQDAD